MNSRERERVVSLNVNVCDEDSIAERVIDLAESDGGYVCFSTAHMVMESYDDPDFAAIVNGADLVVPDGMPLVWMLKIQGRREARRTRGTDMTRRLLSVAEEKDWKVGFYGGSQDVIDRMLGRVKQDFPKLKVSYSYSPPYRPLSGREEAAVIDEIRAANPQFLFVGLGCPKQERWMAKNREKLSSVMLGVGAAFDFFAGNVKESPAWLSRLGLEWLFRLCHEPRRLWHRYLILNPRFAGLAVWQLLSSRK